VQTMSELGVDSLLSVELRNSLQRSSGMSLHSSFALDFPTPMLMARSLLDMVHKQFPADVSDIEITTPLQTTLTTSTPSTDFSDVAAGITFLRKSDDATRCLVCFAQLGGTADDFGRWPEALAADMDVVVVAPWQLFSVLGDDDAGCKALVELVGTELVQVVGAKAVMFYGHSAGGHLAFAVALFLQRSAMALCAPRLVVVGAAPEPGLPFVTSEQAAVLKSGNEAAMVELLVTHFDFPRAMFAGGEALAGVGSLLGLSFKVAACMQAGETLRCPIVAVCGRADRLVPLARARGWPAWTTEWCLVRPIDGGHHFLYTNLAELLALLAKLAADNLTNC